VGLAPTVDEQDYNAVVGRLRDEHVARGPLVAGDPDPVAVIETLVTEVAKEAAALAFDARRAEERGGDSAKTSSRRVEALVKVAGLVLERERLRRESGVVAPELLEKLKLLFLTEVEGTVRETLGDEGEPFIARLRHGLASRPDPARAPGR
jgi:hypothetical protein